MIGRGVVECHPVRCALPCFPDDGIGPEVTAPAVEVRQLLQSRPGGFRLAFTEYPAGAACSLETAVDRGFAEGRLRPMEFGGDQGSRAVKQKVAALIEEKLSRATGRDAAGDP